MLDGSATGAVVVFDGVRLAMAHARVEAQSDAYAAGMGLAHQLSHPALKGMFVLSDGLSVNGSELVRGINSVVPQDTVVTGGLAGDGDRFERT